MLREQLEIKLTLNKFEVERNKEDVDLLMNYSGSKAILVDEGDTLSLNYKIDIDYLGGVEQRLRSIENLLNDPKIVQRVKTRELAYGKSLIQNILLKLEKIERKLIK